MSRSTRCAAAAAVLMLSACSNLDTRPGYLRSSQNEALPGVEYALPMLQYEVAFSYRITGCPDKGPVPMLIKVAATPDYVPGETYTVNYAALAGVLKTSDFTIQTAEGTNILQSVNVSAEDKSADVIKSTVELALKVASIASPVPVPAFTAGQSESAALEAAAAVLKSNRLQRRRLVCSQAAKDQLQALSTAKTEVGKLKPQAEAITKAVEKLTARARLNLASKADAELLVQLYTDQLTLSGKLETEQSNMEDALKKLSFADSRSWPESPSQTWGEIGAGEHLALWAREMFDVEDTEILDLEGLQRLVQDVEARAARRDGSEKQVAVAGFMLSGEGATEFANAVKSEMADQCRPGEPVTECAARIEREACRANETATSCVRRHVAISAELAPASPRPGPCGTIAPADLMATCITDAPTIAARTNVEHKGIFIRPPVKARLTLCRMIDGCGGRVEGPLYRSGWTSAPQLGQLRILPFINKMFQSNALSLTLRRDGSIEKFQYSDKASIAAAAAASLAGAATSVDTYLENRHKKERERLAEAQADAKYTRELVLNERADVKYERDEAAALRGEAAALRAEEIAQVQFEIDRLTKQRELVAKQAAQQPATVAQGFLDETVWLDAQVLQLRSRLALLKAENEFKEANATSRPGG